MSKTMTIHTWNGLLLIVFTFFPGRNMATIVLATGTVAKERVDSIFLRCDVATSLGQEDEAVSATWCHFDEHQRNCAEIFSVDLTSDQPAYFFALSWIGRGQYDPGSMANVVLPSHYVTRDFAGAYRCTIQMTATSLYADVQVDVLYGPGTSIRIDPEGRVERTEGQDLTLTCGADCRPACTYRWYVGGRRVASTSVLYMTSLSRDQVGLYACQARNEAGRSIKPVDVQIKFEASILSLNISTSATVSVSGDETGGLQTTDVQLSCKVQGWPPPKVKWLRSSVPIATTIGSGIASTSSWQGEHQVFHLHFTSASCLKNGHYTCSIGNGIGVRQAKTIPVQLNCSPREVKETSPCQRDNLKLTDESDGNVELVRKWGERVTFHLCFWAFPKPKVFFRRKDNMRSIYEADVTCLNTTNACASSITFLISSVDQYGVYRAEVTNGLRRPLLKTFTVISRQPPRPPQMLGIDDISSSSVCLAWMTGFDGGAPQKVVLTLVRKENKLDIASRTLDVPFSEEDNSTTHRSVCLHDLVGSSIYTVTMTSHNQYGKSNHSREFSFQTPPSPLPSSTTEISPGTSRGIRTSTDSSVIKVTDQTLGKIFGELYLPRTPPPSILDNVLENTPNDLDDLQNDYNKGFNTLTIHEYDDNHNRADDQDYQEYDGDMDDETNLIHSLFLFLETLFQNSSVFRGHEQRENEKELRPRPFFFSQPLYADRYLKGHANFKMKNDYVALTNTSIISTKSIPTHITTTNSVNATTKSHSVTDFRFRGKTMSSITTAMICATVGSLVGVVIGITAITLVVRRRQDRSQCRHKGASENSVSVRPSMPSHGPPSFLNNPASSHAACSERSASTSNGRAAVDATDKLPPFYENNSRMSVRLIRNATHLPGHFRARLSTPDLNNSKQKRTRAPPPSPPPFQTEPNRTLRVPTISVNDVRLSCSSSDVDTSDSTASGLSVFGHNNINNNSLDYLSPSTTLERSTHSSYTSIPQATIEATHSNSYLNLYEMISNRSRSRSPSNIYDPLDCSALGQENRSQDDGEETGLKSCNPATSERSGNDHFPYDNGDYTSLTNDKTVNGQKNESTTDQGDPELCTIMSSHYEEVRSLTTDETALYNKINKGPKKPIQPCVKNIHPTKCEIKPNLSSSVPPYWNTQNLDHAHNAKRNETLDFPQNSSSSLQKKSTLEDQILKPEADGQIDNHDRYDNPIAIQTAILNKSSSQSESQTHHLVYDSVKDAIIETESEYANSLELKFLTQDQEEESLRTKPGEKTHSPLVLRLSNKSQEGSAQHEIPLRVILAQDTEDGSDLVVSGFTRRQQILELSRKAGDSELYTAIDAGDAYG